MEQIRVVIADDDQASRKILKGFVKLMTQFQVIDLVADGQELLTSVLAKHPDLALVDISMPGINGLEAIKKIRQTNPDLQVIFTTGHDTFALEAFEVSAIDYIVKPIEKNRLLAALEKAAKAIRLNRMIIGASNQDKKIAVKTSNEIHFISVREVIFVEKVDRKTVIHSYQEDYESNESLSEWEEKLNGFYKTHRSFLVNLKLVDKIESSGETYLLHFKDYNKHAYVSKQKINHVLQLITN